MAFRDLLAKRWWSQLVRPVYPAGTYEVIPKKWWSPKDRRASKLAAKVVAHMAPNLDQEAREAAFNLAVYGVPHRPPPNT
jgi:hypothetical protein